METLQGLLEALVDWARAIWPGVLGAALAGWFGFSMMGFWGFVVAAAAGALVGTWAGHGLGLVKVRAMTGSSATDTLLYAAGAYILVGIGYFLLQFVFLIGAIVAIAAIALFWLSG